MCGAPLFILLKLSRSSWPTETRILFKSRRRSLFAFGYLFFDGDGDIKGKVRQYANEPDCIATKGNAVIISDD